MTAATSSLSSTSTSTAISSQFLRGARIAKQSSPPPSTLTFRSSRSPRFCAAYPSTAAEREASSSASSHYRGSEGRSDYVAKAASLYAVLGVTAGASCQEIKAAYRRLSRACHPDVVAADCKGTSADQFIQIHAAHSTPSDADKRADYDRNLISGRWRPSRSSVSSTVRLLPFGFRRVLLRFHPTNVGDGPVLVEREWIQS